MGGRSSFVETTAQGLTMLQRAAEARFAPPLRLACDAVLKITALRNLIYYAGLPELESGSGCMKLGRLQEKGGSLELPSKCQKLRK